MTSAKFRKRELERLAEENVEDYLVGKIRKLTDELDDVKKQLERRKYDEKTRTAFPKYLSNLYHWGTIASIPCNQCGAILCMGDKAIRCKECNRECCANCTCTHWQNPKCKYYGCLVPPFSLEYPFCAFHSEYPFENKYYTNSTIATERPRWKSIRCLSTWSCETHTEFPSQLRRFVDFLLLCFHRLKLCKDIRLYLLKTVVGEWCRIEVEIENIIHGC